MKNFRFFAAAVLITWVTSTAAFTPHLDLKDAQAVAEGQCDHDKRTYKCFILAKGDDLYIVAVDNLGVVAVYLADGLKQDYDSKDVVLVWTRIPLRRKDET